ILLSFLCSFCLHKTTKLDNSVTLPILQVQLSSEKAPCDSVNDIWSIVNLSDCLAGAAPVPGAEGSIPNPFTIPTDDISSLSLYLELNDSPCTTPTYDIWSPSPYLELNDSPFTIPTDDIWSPSPYLELNDNPWAIPTDYISSLSPYFELSDSPCTKKMKRSFDAVATNFIPSSDADMSTARIKTNQALEEEIRGINQRLLDTMVTIIRDGNSGTMVKCSFNTITISPKILHRPIEPLHLLIPENYPQSSPTVLLETRPGDDEFSVKGKSRLEVCLGSLHQPLSLEDIAKSWGACVRGVITEVHCCFSAEIAFEAASAALDGGISVVSLVYLSFALEIERRGLEITMSTPGVFQVLQRLVEAYPTACLGVGTVLSADDAMNAMNAGARFIMSPATIKDVMDVVRGTELLYIPGVMTPTEMLFAYTAGAKIVKIYPVSALGGVQYIAALKKPFSHIPMVASQGVTIDSVRDYITHGASAVVLSDAIFSKEAMQQRNYNAVHQLAVRASLQGNEAVHSYVS
ncbi:Mediator of RNA polymerase II transcription subunit 15a, partial [Linum perenne]